jgi:hypothetical protein
VQVNILVIVLIKVRKMSQRSLRNRIVEIGEGDEDFQFEQYRQNSIEEIENNQEKVGTERVMLEIESFEDSQGSQSLDCMCVEVPKNVSPTTSKSCSETPSTLGFDMQSLISIIQNLNVQLSQNLKKNMAVMQNMQGSLK